MVMVMVLLAMVMVMVLLLLAMVMVMALPLPLEDAASKQRVVLSTSNRRFRLRTQLRQQPSRQPLTIQVQVRRLCNQLSRLGLVLHRCQRQRFNHQRWPFQSPTRSKAAPIRQLKFQPQVHLQLQLQRKTQENHNCRFKWQPPRQHSAQQWRRRQRHP